MVGLEVGTLVGRVVSPSRVGAEVVGYFVGEADGNEVGFEVDGRLDGCEEG